MRSALLVTLCLSVCVNLIIFFHFMKYFTVGPSQTHPLFEKHLNAAIKADVAQISHRSAYFTQMYIELTTNVKKLFKAPKESEAVFLGSATEFMERAIQNMSTKETLHLLSGNFGERAYVFAKTAGRKAVRVDARADGSISLDDIPSDAQPELIFLTHSETSVGSQLPKSFIESVCDKFPNALIAIDIVSSAPTADIPTTRMDCIFFSVQKGMGLPAGIGVGILSPRAITYSAGLFSEGTYNGLFHSFPALVKQGRENKTLETPNVLLMHLLNEDIKVMLKKGVATMRKEQKEKAKLLYSAIEKSKNVSPAVTNKAWRSETVIVANTPAGSKPIIEAIKKKGILIASGYNKDKEVKVRIANFPQHSKKDIATIAKLIG
jgi:phosphoserine aminotransferase